MERNRRKGQKFSHSNMEEIKLARFRNKNKLMRSMKGERVLT